MGGGNTGNNYNFTRKHQLSAPHSLTNRRFQPVQGNSLKSGSICSVDISLWAGRPYQVEDCELGNSTGSLLLTCRPGFDGGLSQVFNLEILVTATRSLLRNITRHEPRFQLGQLHASQPVSSETYLL